VQESEQGGNDDTSHQRDDTHRKMGGADDHG